MKLTTDDIDILKNVWTWTMSYDLFLIVKGHVEGYAVSLANDIRVDNVQLVMHNGRKHRRYTIGAVDAVIVKMTDNSVITVSVRYTYQSKGVFVLAGWEDAKKKEELADTTVWSVYVVRCNDNSLYCGVSKNVENRVEEHNGNCRGAKYTRSRRPVSLVKEWKVGSRSEALKAEKRFKKLTKERKEEVCSV